MSKYCFRNDKLRKKDAMTTFVVFCITTLLILPLSASTFQETNTVKADGVPIQPDGPQSPIRKYFTTQKILWSFDDYYISNNYYPPNKGFGGLSELINSYGGYVGINCVFMSNWIGAFYGNAIRNYSVVPEFSNLTPGYSPANINKSLEFFNRSHIEPQSHGWNHTENLDTVTLNEAYQIINFTLWNWYNNYHIKPRMWIGHNTAGNYNVSLALKKFSENYWTVYAENFRLYDPNRFPNHVAASASIGDFFDPLFGCNWDDPCETVLEAQQMFTQFATGKEIVPIRGHPNFLNETDQHATENLSKWQAFINWTYQNHTFINIKHMEAIEYNIDRNNFTVFRNSSDLYTIDLTVCMFNHTILFTNPDGSSQRNWTLRDQNGSVIGVVSDDVFFRLEHGVKYFLSAEPGPGPEPTSWWNSSWSYRKAISINHTQVTSTLTNFPLLIHLIDPDVQFKARPDGYDIVFTDENGIQLNHELEYYNTTTGELIAWVNIPTLNATLDTTLYVYYGNPNSCNQQQREATWDMHFLSVHHLTETSGAAEDSTASNNDGMVYGSPIQAYQGKINKAVLFDSIGDHITLPRVYFSENQFTIEAWMYPQAGARYFISQRSSVGVFLQMASDTYLQYYINGFKDGISISSNTWHHIVLTYDGSTAILYTNGVGRSKTCAPPTWPAEGLVLGDRSSGGRQFFGPIDEVRCSNIARTNGWVTTCYNNQKNPTSFSLIGPEEQYQNHTIEYLLMVATQGSGVVVKTPDLTSYPSGSVVQLTAIPTPGWVFHHWAGDLNGSTNPMGISMMGNRSVTANFTELLPDDFTIIALPDTQEYTYAAGYNAEFYSQTQWIVDNTDPLHIVAVTGEGDLISYPTTAEYTVASTAYSTIENAGIPLLVPVGNHEWYYDNFTNYTTFFPVSRFQNKSYYGGHYGTTNTNSFILFNASGMNFILLTIEYDYPMQSTHLSWANSILQQYNDRRAIVVTHCLLKYDGSWSESGQMVYNALKGNPNLFLMLCGHNYHSTPVYDGEDLRIMTDSGHTIYILLADFQSMPPYLGNGYLRFMTFRPSLNQIQVRTYTPGCLNPSIPTGYLTDADSQFDLFYDMATTPPINNPPDTPAEPIPANQTTNVPLITQLSWTGGDPDPIDTVSYDIYLDITNPPTTKISANQSTTSYTPETLTYDTQYYWKVIAWDNHQAHTTGPTWTFTTTQPPTNNPPNTPSNPTPANQTTNNPITTQLSWSGGDPDPTDTVTYDVYFGTSNPPTTKVSTNQSAITYNPPTLQYSTTYYWKIVAWDNHGASTASPIWRFTTTQPPNNPPRTPRYPSPPHRARHVSIYADLSWTGGDPDSGDSVTYDVYFGTTYPPVNKLSNNQSVTTYNLPTLSYSTTYYWKIIAWDNHGASTIGPTWRFTTTHP